MEEQSADEEFNDTAETILVTGATGNVGSEVVRQLASVTPNVIIKAAGHSLQKLERVLKSDRVEPIQIDYNKPETLREAARDVDSVFLVTPFRSDMAELTSNLLREAKKNDVEFMVVLSSLLAADLEHEITVGRLHRQEEKIVEESGIPSAFLRPNAFMQNFLNFFGHTIKTHDAFYLPAGDQRVGFVDVRDIAAVAVLELTRRQSRHKNKAYHITGPEALSFSQAAEIISQEIDRNISYIDITEEDARKGMKEMGMEDWLADAMVEQFYSIRAGYASQTTTVVEQITGRKPIPFSQFAKDYAEVFK
jgi:uncharacterized protein YbjT (DUF2867 family)